MRVTVMVPKEIELKHVVVSLPIRYGDDDIPYNFPLREGDLWTARIDIDTGKIDYWPEGEAAVLYLKVCDEGVYKLYDEHDNLVAKVDCDYVPHGLIPGEYGDYVELKIDKTGKITNWPSSPKFSEFFPHEVD